MFVTAQQRHSSLVTINTDKIVYVEDLSSGCRVVLGDDVTLYLSEDAYAFLARVKAKLAEKDER